MLGISWKGHDEARSARSWRAVQDIRVALPGDIDLPASEPLMSLETGNRPVRCRVVTEYRRVGGRSQTCASSCLRLWQYLPIRYSQRLAEAGIESSVGPKGDSYDNAFAETINGPYTAEVIHRREPWKTKQAVELATLEWVAWFNHHRLMEPLGFIPPAEF